jgi:hypothetical protein
MDTKESMPATKEDLALTLGNIREVLATTTRSLIRWMFFLFVLNLISYFIFFWFLSR